MQYVDLFLMWFANGVLVYTIYLVLHFVILKTEWAEKKYNPDGDSYTRSSTRPMRQVILKKIVITVLIFLLVEIVRSYI